jgi:hypothetical protein
MVEMNRKENILMAENRNSEERRLRSKIARMEEFIFKQDQEKLTNFFKQTDEKYDSRHGDIVAQREPSRKILNRLDKETQNLKSKKAKILEYLDKDEELNMSDLKADRAEEDNQFREEIFGTGAPNTQ